MPHQKLPLDLYLIVILHDGRILCNRMLQLGMSIIPWPLPWSCTLHSYNVKVDPRYYIDAHIFSLLGTRLCENTHTLDFIFPYNDTMSNTDVYKLHFRDSVHFKTSNRREICAYYPNEIFDSNNKNPRAFSNFGIEMLDVADIMGELAVCQV